MTVGVSPINGDEVNRTIGTHLRTFTEIKTTINQDHDWLLSTDLKVEPYNLTPDEETLIKSAVAGLDATLDAVDMTFISRLTGLF
jgi:hypothetical protein